LRHKDGETGRSAMRRGNIAMHRPAKVEMTAPADLRYIQATV